MINLNKQYFKLIMLIFILLIIPTYCVASDDGGCNCSEIASEEQDCVYVSLDGNNANNGTLDHPKLTLDGEDGAIAYASDNSINKIILGNGTFTVSGIEINDENFNGDQLTFLGSGNTVISAGPDSNMFRIGVQDLNSRPLNITFNSIDFTNSDYYFPAISVFHGYLNILNCNFYDNRGTTSSCVGAYYNSTTKIYNSKFFNNRDDMGIGTVENSAGGFFESIRNNYMYIDKCEFFNNSADTGGAITNYDDASINAIMYIVDSNFTNNTANEGGAIFNNALSVTNVKGSSELYIWGCNFKGNTAFSTGGAIYFGGNSALVLNNSKFEQNVALGEFDISNGGTAGALFAATGSVRIDGCQFNLNGAARGGAIFNTQFNDIIIENSNFTSNNATMGGAVYLDLGGDYGLYSEFINLSFDSNVAKIGAAVFTNDLNKEAGHDYVFNCSNSSFKDNSLYNVGNLGLYDNVFNSSDIFNTGTIFYNSNQFINSTLKNSTGEMEFRFLSNLSGYYGDVVKIKANVTDVFSENVVVFVVGLHEYFAVFNETSGLYEYNYKIRQSDDMLVHGYSLLDNEAASNTISLDVLRLPVNLTLAIDNVFVGDNLTIHVNLSSNTTLLNASISVYIDGKKYNVFVKNGYGKTVVKNSGLAVGEYEATASFGKNSPYYEYTNSTVQFAVVPLNYIILDSLNGTVIDISSVEAYFNDAVRLTANITKDGKNVFYNNTLYFKIDGQLIEASYNFELNQYHANYIVSNNASCEITVNNASSATVNEGILTLLKHFVNLSVEIPDVVFDKTPLVALVNVTYGGAGIDGTVKIAFDNQTYDVDVIDGKASYVFHNIQIGNYTAVATFVESNLYYSTNTTVNFSVKKDFKFTSLQTQNIELYYRNGTRFGAVLLDCDNNPISNQTIVFYINGIPTKVTTNNLGYVSIAVNLQPGSYMISTIYNGTDKYDPITVVNAVKVLSTVEGDNLTKYFRNDSQYRAKFLDNQGNPLKMENVTFNINGVYYTRSTDMDGVAQLNINLPPGEYIITATNFLNGQLYSNVIRVLSTVEGDDLTKYFRNDSQYCAKFLDSQGNPLKGIEVGFNINGVFYNRVTDDYGIAIMNINLIQGDYVITTVNPTCKQFYSNNIKVLPTLVADNLEMHYLDGSSFKVTALSGNGSPAAGVAIKMNINGVIYNKVTDNNGTAYLKINLMPGSYIITSIFGAEMISNDVTVI